MEKEKTLKRDLAIDRFRGIAIFFVVLSLIVGALLGPMAEILEEQGKELPAFFALIDKLFSHHARDGVKLIPNFLPNIIGDNRAGLSLADLFAPMFLFIIGLTIVKSFKSRAEKYGTKQAYFQLAVRSLGLMAVGFLINGLEGWIEVLGGEEYISFDLNHKFAMIGVFFALAAVLVLVISLMLKNKKFKTIASNILKYTLAFIGTICLFFITVRLAEISGGTGVEAFGGNVWDILQNIGLASLFALLFVNMGKTGRLVIVALIFTFFSIFNQFGGAAITTRVIEGGVPGALSSSALILLGSVFVEIWNNKKLYFTLTGTLTVLGLILTFGVQLLFTKRGYTPNYVMLTAALSSLIYAGLSLLNNFKPKFAFFTWWGSSAILTYTSAYTLALLMGGTLLILELVIPVWAFIVIAVVIVALFTLMNWSLTRKGKFVRI